MRQIVGTGIQEGRADLTLLASREANEADDSVVGQAPNDCEFPEVLVQRDEHLASAWRAP